MSTQSLNDKAFPVQGQSVEKKKITCSENGWQVASTRRNSFTSLFTKKPTILAQALSACGFEKKKRLVVVKGGREKKGVTPDSAGFAASGASLYH